MSRATTVEHPKAAGHPKAAKAKVAGGKVPAGPLAMFIAAGRLRFLTASVMPVLIGTTLPFWLRPEGFQFDLLLAIETLAAMVFLHAGANFANEYFDSRSGVDADNPARSQFNGGSGLMVSGVLPTSYFRNFMLVFLVVGALLGIHLSIVTPGWLVAVFGLAGVVLGYGYAAPPLRLGYRGLGEIIIGLNFGVLPVVGAYYVQTGSYSLPVLLASLPIAFAIVLVLWVNEIPDIEPDLVAGKRTLVNLMGRRAASRGGVLTLSLLLFGSLFAAVFTGSLIPLTLVTILSFGLIRTVVVDCWAMPTDPRDLFEAQETAIRLHLIIGLVIGLSALAALAG